jgi:hypothetical protein
MTLQAYVPSLVLTLAIESTVIQTLARKTERPYLRLDTLLLNLLTHPLANLAYHQYEQNFFVVEGGVFLVEAIGFCLISGIEWKRAAGLSLVANLITGALSFAFR